MEILTDSAHEPTVRTTGLTQPRVIAESGVLTLKGSHNTAVEMAVRNAAGELISSASQLQPGVPYQTSLTISDQPEDTRYIDVFLAVYDRQGLMVNLQVWETIDLGSGVKADGKQGGCSDV